MGSKRRCTFIDSINPMSGDSIGLEVTKGAIIILQATVIKFHWHQVFVSDITHNLYSTPPLYCFSGSIVGNGIGLNAPITATLFSDLPSDDIASRKQFDFYRCFHPRNTSTGAYTFYRNTVSPFCAELIDGLVLYPRAIIGEDEAEDTTESPIVRVISESESGTYDMKCDYDDPVAAVMSHVSHVLV